MSPKNILIISYHFAPKNAIGAVRPTKLAKYLTRMGHNVTVLCGKPLDQKIDPMLERDMKELANVHVIRERSLLRWWKERGQDKNRPVTAASPASQAATADAPVAGAASSSKTKLMDSLYLWLAFCADAAFARACLRKLDVMDQQFDVVLSSYGPLSVHSIARKAKRKGFARRWIADFRDETAVPFAWLTPYLKRYMASVIKHADAITCVSSGTLAMMRTSGQVVANGFDTEDAVDLPVIAVAKDTLNFAYCGHVYPGKADILPVLEALRSLIDSGECDLQHIQLHYAGTQSAAFLAMVKPYGLEKCVVNLGFVSRAESLALQKASDVLMVSTWNSAQRWGVVTGKLMEYLMAGRPVICCIRGERLQSDARTIVESTNVGFVYQEANKETDAPALEAYIKRLYDARMAAEPLPYHPNRTELAHYSYPAIASQMDGIMQAW